VLPPDGPLLGTWPAARPPAAPTPPRQPQPGSLATHPLRSPLPPDGSGSRVSSRRSTPQGPSPVASPRSVAERLEASLRFEIGAALGGDLPKAHQRGPPPTGPPPLPPGGFPTSREPTMQRAATPVRGAKPRDDPRSEFHIPSARSSRDASSNRPRRTNPEAEASQTDDRGSATPARGASPRHDSRSEFNIPSNAGSSKDAPNRDSWWRRGSTPEGTKESTERSARGDRSSSPAPRPGFRSSSPNPAQAQPKKPSSNASGSRAPSQGSTRANTSPEPRLTERDEHAVAVEVEVKELDRTLRESNGLSQAEKKRLFHEKLKQWHPDKSDTAHAKEVFQWLNSQKRWYLGDTPREG